VFLRQADISILRCKICGGFLHKNSITVDHDNEIENGGVGNADNGYLVNPYCNSVKKTLLASGFKLKGTTSS